MEAHHPARSAEQPITTRWKRRENGRVLHLRPSGSRDHRDMLAGRPTRTSGHGVDPEFEAGHVGREADDERTHIPADVE
jgi:hypothetical protein